MVFLFFSPPLLKFLLHQGLGNHGWCWRPATISLLVGFLQNWVLNHSLLENPPISWLFSSVCRRVDFPYFFTNFDWFLSGVSAMFAKECNQGISHDFNFVVSGSSCKDALKHRQYWSSTSMHWGQFSGFWVRLNLENLSNVEDILISLKVLMPEEKNLAWQPSGISWVETSIHRRGDGARCRGVSWSYIY